MAVDTFSVSFPKSYKWKLDMICALTRMSRSTILQVGFERFLDGVEEKKKDDVSGKFVPTDFAYWTAGDIEAQYQKIIDGVEATISRAQEKRGRRDGKA